MKTSFWDKVLMFLYVLIALFFGVCMALRPFGVDHARRPVRRS